MTPPLIAMVTDRRRLPGTPAQQTQALVRAVEAAAAAGVDLIQVRERDLSDRALLALVRRIAAVTSGGASKVVVNDRTDVALAAGAAGVHLPGGGIHAARVRSLVPPGFLIGRSVHTEAEAAAEARDRACDYLIFGTVFATASKPAEAPLAGIEGLAAACRQSTVPVLAIGGVTPDRCRAVAAAGAAGVAAIRVFQPPDGSAPDYLAAVVRGIRAAFSDVPMSAR